MPVQLAHVGFGNYVAGDRIVAKESPESAPVQRLIREAKRQGIVLDLTSGRRTRTAALLDTGHLLLLAIAPETLANRMTGRRAKLSD